MKKRLNHTNLILIDYYLGAYAPTIRIDVHSPAALSQLKRLFLSLAEGSEKEVDLAQHEMITASGLHSLILRVIPDSRTIKKNLVLMKNELQRIDFSWVGNSEQWQRCAALVEALIESNKAGHQYLTTEGIDDALVELAYME